ncbi:MAG: pyridoxal phosphate-dependent aminotransferase [Anaerolineaceae bacterium]
MQKNYLSQKVRNLHPSIIRQFFDIAATMKDIISLGIGEPDFTTPEPIINAGIEALRAGQTHYTSNLGVTKLREAICDHLQKLYGITYQPDEIIITVGGSEALYLAATALLENGDEVIIPTPCFVSYQPEVTLAGGIPIEVPTCMEEGFNLDIPAIEKAITPHTRAVIVNSPNNPTGAVASRACMLELARIAEEHDLIVISDEIYDRLIYGVEHVCFPALPGMQKRTILVGGFSKDYAMTGWRLGYIAAPPELIKGMLLIHQYTIMTAPTMSQVAGITAILECEEHVEAMRKEYDSRRRLIVEGLNSIGLPTVEPHGAFYAFPQVSVTGLDESTFAKRLLNEKKVAVVPGIAFGKAGKGFVRCSYATAADQIEEALDRIDQFVKSL